MTTPRSSVVIVGAGSAGAALAARLSEDSERDVVLIEAGATPRSASEFPPELFDASTVRGAVPGHPSNWAYPGRLTPDLDYTVARGRILGGSSTINGGYFVRARPEDFDGWAAGGCPEWAYARVLPVLRDLERDLDLGAGPEHGGDGPIPVRRASQRNPAAVAFRQAALGLGFAEEPDKNAPGPPGVGPVPLNVVDGVRCNTGMAYLNPVRGRPNLTVLGQTAVRRVLFEGERAVGVEVGPAGAGRTIDADGVVLCAGAIATPQLLLLSGVGPRSELERHGIGVVADVGGVGQGFTDHPQAQIGWRARVDVEDATSPDSFTTALNLASPRGGPAGDLEILLAVKSMAYLLTGRSRRALPEQAMDARDLALIVAVQAEESRGSITLVSADPGDRPMIDYRYFEAPGDRERMRHGIRTAVALLRSAAFRDVFDRLTDLDDTTLSDDGLLDEWMLGHLHTAAHLCGSARMGAADDPGAVVDQYGRVRGTAGLRVADTSILPTAPSRGPAATAVLIGELVARFIRDGD